MFIVVEGCDGVGKSTLVRQLTERLDGEVAVHHFGPPKAHPLEECILPFNDYRPGVGVHVVCDRFTLGELIYGPIYRGESLLGGIDGPGHRWVDAWLRAAGAVVLHVDATLETVLERIDVRGDDYVKTEHLGRILADYRSAVAASTVLRRSVVCPGVDPSDLIITARSAEHNAATALLADIPHVGNGTPQILLVGDEPSPRHARGERPTYRAPFVPYRDGCGWFLFGALQRRDLARTAVVNQVDLRPHGRGLAERLEAAGVGVAAMGRRAEKTLTDLGIRHGVVPHPQHVRRFHHGRQAEYGENLIEAAEGGDELTHRWRAAP